jgi:hypothetical protein
VEAKIPDNEVMSLTDYALDLALIGLVFLQIRGRRLSLRMMLIPVAIVAWVASNYLHGIPTAGNDLLLIGACSVVGCVLGILCGVFTSVKMGPQGYLISKAGIVAATLWVVGVGTRFAFQLYATHGGGNSILRWSASHNITSQEAWTAALVLMAIGEVLCRTAVIGWRGYQLSKQITPDAGAQNPFFSSRRRMMGARERSF